LEGAELKKLEIILNDEHVERDHKRAFSEGVQRKDRTLPTHGYTSPPSTLKLRSSVVNPRDDQRTVEVHLLEQQRPHTFETPFRANTGRLSGPGQEKRVSD